MAVPPIDLVAAKKDYILDQISLAVKELQKQQFTSETPQADPIANGHPELQRLCEHLDHALLHGIKAVDNGYWAYVADYTRKDELHLIQHLTSVSTDLGRGRSWLYQALNENALENYFRLFTENEVLLTKYYQQEALLRDEQRVPVLLTVAAGLEFIVFELTIDCEYFDYGAFTPSKAGLLNVGPLTPTKLAAIHNNHIAKRDGERSVKDNENGKDQMTESTEVQPKSVVSKLRSLFSRSVSVERNDMDVVEFPAFDDCQEEETSKSLPDGCALQDLSTSKNSQSRQSVAETIASKARSVKEFTVTTAAAAKTKAAGMLNRAASLFSDLQTPSGEKKDFAAVEAETAVVARVRTASQSEVNKVVEKLDLPLKSEGETVEFNQMSRIARIAKVMEESAKDGGRDEKIGNGMQTEEVVAEEEAVVRLEVKHLVKKTGKGHKKKRLASEKKKRAKSDQGASRTPDSDTLSVCTIPGDSQTVGAIIDADASVDTVTEPLTSPIDGESQEVAHELIHLERRNSTVDKQADAEGETEEPIHQEEVTVSSRKLEKKQNISKADFSVEETNVKQQEQEVEPVRYTSIYESSADGNEGEDQLAHSEDIPMIANGTSQPESVTQTDESSKEIAEQTVPRVGGNEDDLFLSEDIERQLSLKGEDAVEMSAVVCADVGEDGQQLDEKELEREKRKKKPKGQEGGKPHRPALTDEDYHSADVKIDHNTELMLRLEVLEKEEETLTKLLRVFLCHGKNDYQSAYILLTDYAIYALSKDGKGGRFDRFRHWQYEFLSHLEVSLNWQTVSIVDTSLITSVIVVGNEAVARLLVDTIRSTMSAIPFLKQLTVVTSDEARVKAVWQVICPSSSSKSVSVLHYSLINWVPVGDAPGPIGSSTLNHRAVMEGQLLVQFKMLAFSFWQEDYFVLDIQNGVLLQYGSKADRECKNNFSLRAGKCGGVHRRLDVDKPNAFEIVSMDKGVDSLVLAASSEEAVAGWLQAVCEAVAGAGTGVEEPHIRNMACSLFILPEKIYLLNEYHTDQLPEVLAHCDVCDISSVGYDTDFALYSLLNFEFSESEKSGEWLFFFSSEYELGKFEKCLSAAWHQLFQTALPFVPVEAGRLRDRARETVTLLQSSAQRNDSVTRGREKFSNT